MDPKFKDNTVEKCLVDLKMKENFEQIYTSFGRNEKLGKKSNFNEKNSKAPNPIGLLNTEDEFTTKGKYFALTKYLEKKFNCAGMCGTDPPIFYVTKGLETGQIPKTTCFEQYHSYFGLIIEETGKWCIACGTISLIIFLIHFGLYMKTYSFTER